MDDELAQAPEELRAACRRAPATAAGFRLSVHPGTLDVTVDVQLRPGEPHP